MTLTYSIGKKDGLIFKHTKIYFTRQYPLRGYFLGVLMHKTAWDQLQGGDETLNCVEYTYARLPLAQKCSGFSGSCSGGDSGSTTLDVFLSPLQCI